MSEKEVRLQLLLHILDMSDSLEGRSLSWIVGAVDYMAKYIITGVVETKEED